MSERTTPAPGADPYPQNFTENTESDDDLSMIDVYAGPRQMKELRAMEGVYAGPVFSGNIPNVPEQEEFIPALPRDTRDDGKESVCPSCGTAVPYGKYCIECGALLPAGLMIRCPQCGSVVGKTKFCAECGAPLAGDEKGGETE